MLNSNLDSICAEGVLLFQFNNNNTLMHHQGRVLKAFS